VRGPQQPRKTDRERPRRLDERIARVRSRAIPKDFLDGVPRPDPYAVELARVHAKEAEDWERRKQTHLNFLETTETQGLDEAFYRIRMYIQNDPFRMIGEWVEDATEKDGGCWYWGRGYDSPQENKDYRTAVDKVRQHIIEIFREVLGDKVCSHGHPWEEWKRVFDWEEGGAGCGNCRVVYEATRRGKLELVDFPDAELVKNGNTKSANTILNWVKLDLRAGLQRNEDGSISSTANHEKLVQIEHGVNSTRSQAQGLGPDSFDKKYEDKSGGSQDNSLAGRGDRTFHGDKRTDSRTYDKLPKFDENPFPLEAHHDRDSKPIEKPELLDTEPEIETDSDNYDPNTDPELEVKIKDKGDPDEDDPQLGEGDESGR
jgi:hypothetical protein